MSQSGRRDRVRELLAGPDGSRTSSPERVCAACVQVLGVTGAGVTIMGSAGQQGFVHGTDHTARSLESMQITVGEGPAIAAFADRAPVLVGDLHRDDGRWPAFTDLAHAAGVAAVFAFPLQIGANSLGVLELYRDRPRDLSEAEVADALVLADLATAALLRTPPGAAALTLLDRIETHAGLYQASGIVMVQLGVDPQEALVRIRAYAYAHGLTVDEVSRRILEHRLKLEGN